MSVRRHEYAGWEAAGWTVTVVSPWDRLAGVIVVAATQRPSADIISASLRDLLGYRWAFGCTTDASSNVILGHGRASEGYAAADIDPAARGIGWVIAEGGTSRRIKTAYFTDDHATRIAEHAARLRTRDAIADGMQEGGGAA